jgi:hypothetical protein
MYDKAKSEVSVLKDRKKAGSDTRGRQKNWSIEN